MAVDTAIGRLNHVGIAVPTIEAGLATYRDLLGGTVSGDAFDLPAQGVRVCFVDVPNSQIELIAPLGEGSPIAKFIARNPAGGQHHVCFEVADIEAARVALEAKGGRLIAEPRVGAHGTPVFFLHPRETGGTLVEIMQAPEGAH